MIELELGVFGKRTAERSRHRDLFSRLDNPYNTQSGVTHRAGPSGTFGQPGPTLHDY